jgi:hypothetical protein
MVPNQACASAIHSTPTRLRSPLNSISLGGALKMKRRIVFILLLVLATPLALLTLGGLSYALSSVN